MLVTPVNSVFSSFYKPEQNNQTKTLLPVALSGKSNKEKIVSSKNIFAILGSFAGAVIPMLFMRNKNEKFLKSLATLNYSCKNIILLANSALIGGYLGGLVDNKGKDRKAKTKELLYQSLTNITFPTLISAGLLDLTKNVNLKKPVLNAMFKFGVNAVGFVLGMLLGREAMLLVDKNIKEERKVKPKDFLMLSDDIPTILALTKQKFFGLEQLVPICAFTLGVETGTKK